MTTATPPDADAIAVLADLRSAGVTVTAEVELVGPADFLTDERLAAIRHHKPTILRLLVNPYRHRCINPPRQRVCDLIADAYDRDVLEAMHLARTWYAAMDDARRTRHPSGGNPDAAAWAALQRGAASCP